MITKKEFDTSNFPKRASTNRRSHPIYLFLKKNKGHAFKTLEIVKGTKMKQNTVRGMLTQLIKDKLVSHNTPYFMFRR